MCSIVYAVASLGSFFFLTGSTEVIEGDCTGGYIKLIEVYIYVCTDILVAGCGSVVKSAYRGVANTLQTR